MSYYHEFATVSEALPTLCDKLLNIGATVPSRNGETRELLNIGITLTDPLARGVWTPHRNASIAAQIAETAWVLAGRNDIDFLLPYLPRAADFSDDGRTWRAAYGPRLRAWGASDSEDGLRPGLDQLDYVVALLRAKPDTRQAVIQIYDPALDSGVDSKDIPCNDWMQFIIRDGRLHLHVAVRSNDLVWGWSGINTFEWSTLLEVVANLVGVQAGTLNFAVTSFHLYSRHYARAHRMADALPTPEPGDRVRFELPAGWVGIKAVDTLLWRFFDVERAIRAHPNASATEELVAAFPEPMLRSWLWVLLWWWSGNEAYLTYVAGTTLEQAARAGLHNPRTTPEPAGPPAPDFGPFLAAVTSLHNEKSAAYGDSWCRRGEAIGILANIARKVDRLGGGATSDETEADTAIDLFVYLAKYRVWLQGELRLPGLPWAPTGFWDSTDPSETAAANAFMRLVASQPEAGSPAAWQDVKALEYEVLKHFGIMEMRYHADDPDRWETVDTLAALAFRLAYQRWSLATEQRERAAAWRAGNERRRWNPET